MSSVFDVQYKELHQPLWGYKDPSACPLGAHNLGRWTLYRKNILLDGYKGKPTRDHLAL